MAEWRELNTQYSKALLKYKNMLQTAAAMIFDTYCTESMKNKLTLLSS